MGKHKKNVPINCFSYRVDVGSDSLPLFTDGQQVLGSVSIWIHKEPFIRKESPCLPRLPWETLSGRDC